MRTRWSSRILLVATAVLYISTCVSSALAMSVTFSQARNLDALVSRAYDLCTENGTFDEGSMSASLPDGISSYNLAATVALFLNVSPQGCVGSTQGK